MIDKSTYKHLDVRAEVLIAEILERNSEISLNDLAIEPSGKFNYTIGRDIRDIGNEENQYGVEVTKIIVARPGLYDALPAGLFHRLGSRENRNRSSKKDEVLVNIKIMNREEREARRYFAPFDQVINRYRVLIEQEERQMLTGFPLDSSHTLFDIIWGEFDLAMSNYQKTILFTLLPMAHQIIGDLEYTRTAFEMVIGYPVTIDKNYRQAEFSIQSTNTMGSIMLSEDFILGDISKEINLYYDINIGPIPMEECDNYLPKGKGRKIIELLASYLVPMEIDTNFYCHVESKSIELNSNEIVNTSGDNRLGYSIHI